MKKKTTISQYQKDHNTLCLSLQSFAQALFPISLGTIMSQEKNNAYGGQAKSIVVISILANRSGNRRH